MKDLPLLSAFSADPRESRIAFTVMLLATVTMSLAQSSLSVLYHLLHAGPWRPQQLFLGGSERQCNSNI